MLKVLPIQSKEDQRTLCAICGIPYDADLMAYVATVDDRTVGICQFTIKEDGGSLRDLVPVPGEAPDAQALLVMGRAALNFIDLCGTHIAFFDGDPAPAGEELIHAIGFRRDETKNGRLTMNLTNFFNAPCQHAQN